MRWALLVIGLVALAGCGQPGTKATQEEDLPTLQATDSTGVIRALVVDPAIRPLAGVTVTVRGAGAETPSKVTGDDGFAGFEDLDPSTYVVEATKPGYAPATQTVAVVAGVDDPPIAKFLLTPEVGQRPFYVELHFEGFMQCAVSGFFGSANTCFIANYYPCFAMQTAGQSCMDNLTDDNSYFPITQVLDYQKAPDWIQLELVWESTQSIGTELQVRLDYIDAEGSIDGAKSAAGESPVLLTVDAENTTEEGIGTEKSLAIETFGRSATVGPTVQQKLDYYVHIFYGYTPPPDWRFTNGTGVPQPPY